jgi:hypothetical protein
LNGSFELFEGAANRVQRPATDEFCGFGALAERTLL